MKEIHVSLEAKEAKVSFDSSEISAEKIANYIEDMGFDTHVKEVDGQGEKKLENVDKTKQMEKSVKSINGAGDVKSEKTLAKCVLHVQVRFP